MGDMMPDDIRVKRYLMMDKRKLAFPLFSINITLGIILLAVNDLRLCHFTGLATIGFSFSVISLALKPNERKRNLSSKELALLCISLLMAPLAAAANVCIHHLLDASYAMNLALLIPFWIGILLPAFFLCRLLSKT